MKWIKVISFCVLSPLFCFGAIFSLLVCPIQFSEAVMDLLK